MKDTIDMTREAGGQAQQNKNCDVEYLMSADALKAFEVLVRADERARIQPAWKQSLVYARQDEREACAKVCADIYMRGYGNCGDAYDAIRSRGETK